MGKDTFVEAEVWTVARTEQGNAVLVRPKGADVAVPIFIGPLETQSILIGLSAVEVPRPLTHDLLLAMARGLGAEVQRVEIHSLQEGTFLARLILEQDGIERSFDSRPSDALAAAVRVHCPIFIAESIVEEAGISVHLVNEGQGVGMEDGAEAAAGPVVRDERAALEESLERAVEEEDYEEAARIRDRLRELDGGATQ